MVIDPVIFEQMAEHRLIRHISLYCASGICPGPQRALSHFQLEKEAVYCNIFPPHLEQTT